jgi:hypothetical protein
MGSGLSAAQNGGCPPDTFPVQCFQPVYPSPGKPGGGSQLVTCDCIPEAKKVANMANDVISIFQCTNHTFVILLFTIILIGLYFNLKHRM